MIKIAAKPTGRWLTLDEALGGEAPHEDEMIWQFIGEQDFDVEFAEVTVDPYAICHAVERSPDLSLCEMFQDAATRDDKRTVERYRKLVKRDPEFPMESHLIIDSDLGQLIDGYHRVVAYEKEGVRKALALDLARERK